MTARQQTADRRQREEQEIQKQSQKHEKELSIFFSGIPGRAVQL
jgi:hypothetical protein